MLINLSAVFIIAIFCLMTMVDTAMAGGAVAQRRAASTQPGQSQPSNGQPSTGRPTIQGPPINLGRRKTQVYAPPRTKSVNLPPVLPYERREETPKAVVKPEKKQEQVYPSQVLSSAPANNSSLARASYSPQMKSSPSISASAPPAELAALFERFDHSSEPWIKINDPRIKALIVEHYVDLYKQFDVQIGKPAAYYSNLIDAMSQNNPKLLTQPFDQVLRIVSILEYDYNSGENKDMLAASILTDKKAFLQNKQRLGIK